MPKPTNRYHSVEYVDVLIWGNWVGRIAQNPQTGFYAFSYTPDWIASGVELAPLRMPLRAEPYEFSELSVETYYRLPALFADSLPDKFGNALVDAWLAERGVSRNDITALDRLAYAGERAMGALTFHPATETATAEVSIIQVADLVASARQSVHGFTNTEMGLTEALQQLIQVGTSAGGARAKAVIQYHRETSQLRSGQAPAQPGFEHYLLKLDGVANFGLDGRTDSLGASTPYGRIEYAYYLMAVAAGIEMETSTLLLEGPRAHFLTKRFDRGAAGERHHLITLCGLDHLDFNLARAHSYDQYFDCIKKLGLGMSALSQAYRRMLFNVFAVNRDDHTKNFSFLRRENGGWELSPAYDLTFAYNATGKWTQTHQMQVNSKLTEISLADLAAVGDRHDIPGYKKIITEVKDVVSDWENFAKEAGVPKSTARAITKVMKNFQPR